MSWLLTTILELAAIAVALFLLAALFAPFESLGWWAGWSKRWPDPISLPPLPPTPEAQREPACFLVFLTGVGTTDADQMAPKEQHFMRLLAARLPGAAVVTDIFPYSPVNNPLTGARPTGRFWSLVKWAIKQPATHLAWHLVAVRNDLQVAVSADRRYGPLFNFGVARTIVLRLIGLGYRPGSRAPIVLIGRSGGGQIAVGSGAALHRLLCVPVWVISVGGVLTSDRSILEIEHVYHLSGSEDQTQYLGRTIYPGCWPIMRGSAWNRALAQGKLTIIPVGPMKHMGHGDYFCRTCSLPDGATYVEHTADVVAGIVAELLPAQVDQTVQWPQTVNR